jgi:benzoyl-CoA reductase subunit C
MPVSDVTDGLRAEIDDLSHSRANEWKQSGPGRKIVGCYPVYTPVELVHAAGMLPVLVAGGGGKLDPGREGSMFQAFMCSIGQSTSELLGNHKLDYLDGMLFPSICEVSRALSGVMARAASDKPFVYIHFPQNLDSAHAHAYLVGELGRVKTSLEKLGGKKIADDSIRESFKVYNRRAELLNELDILRSDRPDRLSASEYYILRLAGMGIPPEEHISILSKALKAASESSGRPEGRLRMVLFGAFCERPPVTLIETLETLGVDVVADDMLLGQRWWTEPLPLDGDPIEVLAGHYLKHAVVNSVVHRKDPDAMRDRVLSTLHERRAAGVLVAAAQFCHPAVSDNTAIVKACEEAGVPYIRLEFEEGMSVFVMIYLQIGALLQAREHLPTAGTENGRVKS